MRWLLLLSALLLGCGSTSAGSEPRSSDDAEDGDDSAETASEPDATVSGSIPRRCAKGKKYRSECVPPPGWVRRLCEDDIRTRLGKMDRRGLAKRSLGPASIEELTSRLAAADIPRKLDAMEREFDPVEEEKRRKRDKSAKPSLSPEAIALQQMMRGIHF